MLISDSRATALLLRDRVETLLPYYTASDYGGTSRKAWGNPLRWTTISAFRLTLSKSRSEL
jgi:hypothetical protein